ncbi:uncharacterized protein LKV04_000947 [Tautogolabrus adspersus]
MWGETMSEDLRVQPGLCKTVHRYEDDKESVVNIYVSAESLKVYDNPWMEGMSPNIPEPAEAQHSVSVNRQRRRNRADSAFRAVVCLLLVAGIMALIYLAVQMKYDKASWESERKKLMEEKPDFKEMCERLFKMFCGKKNKTCAELDGCKTP